MAASPLGDFLRHAEGEARTRVSARATPIPRAALLYELLAGMVADMTEAAPGVLRRKKADVPETLTTPISVFRKVRDTGQFIVDALADWHAEIREMQRRANENKR